MHADVVIAIGPEETLPAILSHIHQSGLGHNAFLVRPRRMSIEHQLRRSGIPTDDMPIRVDDAGAALVIHAAARAPLAADITRRHGASATWIVSRDGVWNLVDDDIAAPTAVSAAAPAQVESRPKTSPAAPAHILIPVINPETAPDESAET